MNKQLQISNIRNVLIRLEETILFALIERVQFRRNPVIYAPGAFADLDETESLVGYLLHETERIHARMRRYTSPDEYPFFDDLPEPVLPELRYDDNPLHAHPVNLNRNVWASYTEDAIPLICAPDDDHQYGSCAVADVTCLQAISKRIHYGMFVAEGKYRKNATQFDQLVKAKDAGSIAEAITDAPVEQQVLERVRRKAELYLQELNASTDEYHIEPEVIVKLYRTWIIPATKEVEVQYLLKRG
ncbi:MAG: chorismate mutase [Lentisphaeria bacterium]